MGLFHEIIRVIKDPDIINSKVREIERLDNEIGRLLAKHSTYSRIINDFKHDVDCHRLIRMPDARSYGDKIYLVSKDSFSNKEMCDTVIMCLYGDAVYYLSEFTVDHIIYKDGLTYYAIQEIKHMSISTIDPMVFENIDEAFAFMRSHINASEISGEVIVEFVNKNVSAIIPSTFVLPCGIGTAIYEKTSTNECDDEIYPIQYTKWTVDAFIIGNDHKVNMRIVKSHDEDGIKHTDTKIISTDEIGNAYYLVNE